MRFNILNPVAPAEWLRSLCPDPAACDLVVLALERSVTREVDFLLPDIGLVSDMRPDRSPVGHHFLPSMASAEKIADVGHVVDWIVASVRNEESWLKRTDPQGRPLKLLKIGSIDRAVREADKAMRRLGSRMTSLAEDRRGETTWRDLDDGWRLVRLTTPESLDAESVRMQHCIGQGAYDGKLCSADRLYLSLRDPSDRPHATLEVDPVAGRLLQMQGKQNDAPQARYVRRLIPFLTELRDDMNHLGRIGLVCGTDGRIHEMSNLPDDLSVEKALNIHVGPRTGRLPSERVEVLASNLAIRNDSDAPVVLPRIIHVFGNLNLFGNFVFPEGSQVRAGNIYVADGRIEGFPETSFTTSLMHLTDVRVGRLPAGLDVGLLAVCRSDVSSIPDDARIRSLDLFESEIAFLPTGIRFSSLGVQGGALKELPDGLVVEGDAHVVKASLERLGNGTRIGGKLVLANLANLSSLPDDFHVGQMLRICDCPIGRIPDDLDAKSLDLENLPKTTLPDRICIEGSLSLKHVKPRTMSSDIHVGSSFVMEETDDIVVPAGTRVGGAAKFVSTGGSVTIGEGTEVAIQTTIHAENGMTTERNVRLGRTIEIRNARASSTLPCFPPETEILSILECENIQIPERFGARSLFIAASKAIRLPEDLSVEESLEIVASSISRMPVRMRIGGNLRLDARCEYGIRIPDGTRVSGNASIRTGLEVISIGENVAFERHLDLNASHASIGEGLHVGGVMSGDWSGSLPDGCRIGFFGYNPRLTSIGRDCHFGDMNIGTTDVETLPDDIVVGGTAILPHPLAGKEMPPGLNPAKVEQEGCLKEPQILKASLL